MVWSSLIALSLSAASLALQTSLLVQDEPAELFDVKVPVVLGVMSKCPDAIMCESVFDRVVSTVSDRIDFSLSYVAQLNESEPEYGVTCKHGPEECAGNIQQLCVAKYEPLSKWWEFVQCHNYQGREQIGKPDVALRCANTAKIDWEGSGIAGCVGSDVSGKTEEGIQLLKQSLKETRHLNVVKSCTVVINGYKVCVRDDYTWKECEAGHAPKDFIRQINEEYRRLNSDSNRLEDNDE
ncbi:hypothetical protein NEOLEDRAFT_1067325 [Neolentinus lepideus HHB14362 ss-1]|uniref:GILT-domain-containing protein n=1 Tax=Neolentinus lepideus HHB14362 ss-1 TaxID=1314782 RepID=A0A165S0P3_9AGAM|nr:hypothetical protein NEOLEDRAFT_1067325 [Neolentinus lepideus HHB14362 ss-1]